VVILSYFYRDLPFDAIEFVAYEQLRKAYGASLGGKRSINGLETGAIGAARQTPPGVPPANLLSVLRPAWLL